MAYHITVIETNGERSNFIYEKEPPALGMFQDWLGGHLEAVPYFEWFGTRKCVAFCNEEGKLDGLPVNTVATYLWRATTPNMSDVLVGNIVIVGYDTEEELKAL
jgi:hypothetical protein